MIVISDKLTTFLENKTYATNYLIVKANNYHTVVKNSASLNCEN